MARSDAVGKEPTIDELNAESAAQFKGFSTTDGEVSKGEATPEEKTALAAREKQDAAGKVAAAKVEKDDDAEGEETPEEKTAREAAEAKLTDKQKAAKALQVKVAGKDAPKHRSANDRIGQAVAKQRAAERALDEERGRRAAEMDEVRRELAALKAGALTTPAAGAKPPVDKDAPRATDYEYGELDGAYIRDLARYETRKELAAEKATNTAATQTEAQRREAQEMQAKATKFAAAGDEVYDDFAEVVVQSAAEKVWPLSKTFGDLMFDSEEGPHIAYYLATHVKEAERIMGLAPTAQAAAFGRLEAAFSSKSSDATQQDNEEQEQPEKVAAQKVTVGNTTKAPLPPKHLARGNGGKTQVGADTTDFAAFERLASTT